MINWEVDIDILVRKTLAIGGPETEDAVRQAMEAILADITRDRISLIKWRYGSNGMLTPVERDLGRPVIADIRRQDPGSH